MAKDHSPSPETIRKTLKKLKKRREIILSNIDSSNSDSEKVEFKKKKKKDRQYRKKDSSSDTESKSRKDKKAKKKKKRNSSSSPEEKRRKKSPKRKSRSRTPPRTKSPVRRRSRSKSPARRKSRTKSPVRRRSRTKSPVRRRSRTKSPARRKSRTKSPVRRRSRTKSPARRKSRTKSPVRRRSRTKSPVRRRSRTPPRRSRSPRKRRRTPSPKRRRSPSPKRRPSPRRHRSRSPRRRSPERRRSRERKRSKERERSRRSRSRDKKSRSRSRDKKSRSRSRDRKSSPAKRHKTPVSKKKSKSKSPVRKTRRSSSSSGSGRSISPRTAKLVEEGKKKATEFQLEMEKEMEKRKERIEAWRAERKKKEDGPSKSSTAEKTPKKVWSLEDDEEDDEEPGESKTKVESEEDEEETTKAVKQKSEPESDVDPLDAFMDCVSAEIKTINKNPNKKKITKLVGGRKVEVSVKAKVQKEEKKKGDLLLNDAEAMEYSSEDMSDDDLDDMNYAGYKNKKRRELEAPDHAKMDYEEFRKDFYVEVPELAKITDADLADIHENLENMQVRGRNPPKPIKSWIQAGTSMKVLNILKKFGYAGPTPIQSIALPAIMSGRDLIGIAKTGSGKTLAFLIPMFRHIMDQRPLEADEGPIALLMSPTRELALQTYNEARKFTKALKLRVVCVYGGTGISEQIAELKRGCEIIVCTPGRMIDMLTANSGRVTNCKRVTYVVFDEADRMFDMGFEPQVNKIIGCIRPDRQTVMFSATFPRQMEALARKLLTKPIEVTTGGRSMVCADVDQNVIIIDDEEKLLKLMEILGHFGEGQSLIFVHTQERADNILRDLMHASYSVMALHGGMDQHDRDSVIHDFKQGNIRVLVATSVAARGLDVKALRLVVNFDCPNHYEDYVHRVGRTGRAGMKGTAYTFLQRDQARYAGDLINALESSSVRVPTELDLLWKEYVAEQKDAGLKVEKNRGFSGKGFKFNDEEAQRHDERKQLQKFSLGLQDSDDEDILQKKQDELETAIEAIMGGKGTRMIAEKAHTPVPTKIDIRKGKTIEEKVGHLQGSERAQAICSILAKVKQPDPAAVAGQSKSGVQGPSVIDPTAHATSAFMKGERVTAVSGKGLAAQIAASINAKKNFTKADEEQLLVNPAQAPPCKVEEEIEINDLPQQARYRITSKDAIAGIQEYSECALTVRGTYYPPNKNPPEGMRKLFICIEAAKERSIQLAKMELKRMIKEELSKAQMFSFGSGGKAGRYQVL